MGRRKKAEPLQKVSQWEDLIKTNDNALPPTKVKAGLFTAACEKVKATPRQILKLASPAAAASTNTARPADVLH